MNNYIKKGYSYYCKKDFYHTPGTIMFKRGDVYACKANNCLTDRQGNKRIGWNQDAFKDHFHQLDKPETITEKALTILMILGALVGLLLMFLRDK